MTSVNFSSTSVLTEWRRGMVINSFKSCTDRESNYACISICAVNPGSYSFLSPENKTRMGRKQIRFFDIRFECEPRNPSKEISKDNCFRVSIGYHSNSIVRLKNTRVLGVEGTSEPCLGSNLTEADARITSDVNRLALEKPVLNLAQVRVKKLWKQFVGERKRKIHKSGSWSKSRKVEKPIAFNRSDMYLDADKKIKLLDAVSAIQSNANIDECNSLLKLLEKTNDEKSLDFFQWMKMNGKLMENTTAYNTVLRVLSRKEDWKMAESLLQEMVTRSGCQIDFRAFNTLIYVCYKRGLVEQGSKWFRMMLEHGVRPNLATVGMLMSLYQKGGNLAEAEFTFNQMRIFKLHCQTAYSAMITIYTRLGLYNKAEDIMNIMKEDNVIPNLENWLVQLNAYCQQGKLDMAELVLVSMQKDGISPHIVAYNTLITGYGKVVDMESACRIFQSLQSIGIEPDETTYRSMIEGFGRTRNYEMTLFYYKQLKLSGFHPNSSNFYTMINLQAECKDDDGITETLNDMIAMGCQYSSILGSLLKAYEKVGRVDKVPTVLKSSIYEKVLFDQTSCSLLAMAFVQNDLLDDALRILLDKKWEDQIYEEHLYHLLICTCKEAGRYEDAVKIFSQMSKSGTTTNLYIICSMIDIYTLMGRFKNGEDLYLKLKSTGVALDMITYSVVVRMYVKCGSLEDACMVLDTMDKQKDITPDTYLFCDMLRIYQKCDMREKLRDVYYKILKSGMTWDEALYNCVINCCARALPVDELSRLFDQMVQCGFAANTITFNILLDVYGKAGLLKKARKVLWMARRQHMADSVSYSTLIAAYGKNKDFKNMKSIFRRMEFAGIPIPLEAYNSMLDAYGKEDRIEEFKDTLQKMRESSCVSDHYTYNIMINIYGRKGWIEEVATVLADLKDQGLEPDLWSYNSLIKAYGIAGMVEEAVNVVKEMRERGIDPDKVTYANLIGALQKNDNFLEAVKWSLWMKQLGMAR